MLETDREPEPVNKVIWQVMLLASVPVAVFGLIGGRTGNVGTFVFFLFLGSLVSLGLVLYRKYLFFRRVKSSY